MEIEGVEGDGEAEGAKQTQVQVQGMVDGWQGRGSVRVRDVSEVRSKKRRRFYDKAAKVTRSTHKR